MTYKQYVKLTEQGFSGLDNKDKLFWNLWCIQYVFERIDQSNPFYEDLSNAYIALWDYQDTNSVSPDDWLNKAGLTNILEIDDDDFNDLDDLEVSERSVKEMIVGVESMIMNLQSEGRIIYNAGEIPINVIDVEIDGISISDENTSEIFLNEANAHITLLEELASPHPAYTFKDRNIHRKNEDPQLY